MNKSLWFILSSIFLSSTLNMFVAMLLLFFTRKASSTTDPMYLTCKESEPKSCGNGINISFPFYIRGQQDPSCGYPGFDLTCDYKGRPILTMSENNYIIQHISYENETLNLLNDGWFDPNDTACVRPIQNLSLPHDRYKFSDSVGNLSLFYSCTSTPVLLSDYFIETENCNSSVLAVSKDDYSFVNQLTEYCKYMVMVPVNMYGDVNKYNTSEVITRGFDLIWIAAVCKSCVQTGGICGFNYTTYKSQCYCHDRPHTNECPATPGIGGMGLVIKLAIGGSSIAIFVLVVLCGFFICMKINSRKFSNVEHLIEEHALSPKRFSYPQIKKITNNFRDILGEGAFGIVYRGKLRNGKVVAVKVLNNKLNGDYQDFINEVASISRTSHKNIVGLLGFCFQGRKRALIYEFLPKGSLEKLIYNDDPSNASEDRQLGWEVLYQISLGIAKGLEYLHTGCKTRIVHFDIKPHNILLDEDFCPKISDFGLAKLCPGKESNLSMAAPRGTRGYMAPEMYCINLGEVSHKSDVYSYGMMVLEMVGGRKNLLLQVDRGSEIYFPLWIYKRLETSNELGLQGIGNEEDNQLARKMTIVSLWCIQTNPSTRPSISEVVDMLEGNVDPLPIPPNPHLTSSSANIS